MIRRIVYLNLFNTRDYATSLKIITLLHFTRCRYYYFAFPCEVCARAKSKFRARNRAGRR